MIKKIILCVFLINTFFLFSEPIELDYLRKSYPDFYFESKFISSINDYLISVKNGNQVQYFIWADSKMLLMSEFSRKDEYNSLFYNYLKEVPDPKNFSESDIEKIKEYTSFNNRKNSLGTPTYFYDFIYDCSKRKNAESHIISTSFLGKPINIHEKIKNPLKKVETKILNASKTDDDVKKFLDNLARTDCYNWREISDSGKKSLHSVGIAVDILPKGWGQKNLYWSWRRDIDKENWMNLPLERRWFPPVKVIEIFESEGFVYGGKWINWDNMHFEYTPEILLYNHFEK